MSDFLDWRLDILTTYTKYEGPPTPQVVREWTAFVLQLVPHVNSVMFGVPVLVLTPFCPIQGTTEAEAVEGLRSALRQHFDDFARYGVSVSKVLSILVPVP